MKEVWKHVVGWKGLYEISSLGRVKSLCRVIIKSDGRRKPVRERILRSFPDKDGYPRVNLNHRGKVKTVRVHALVCAAFRGKRPKGQQVRHRDGVRDKCQSTNLHYGTARQNSSDMVKHGTVPAGGRNGRAVLTADDVLEIRVAYDSGACLQKELASRYLVSQKQISRIVRREKWSSL